MSTESPKFICPEIKNNEKSSLSFSVIMPTFNQCAFIRRAVASLIGQTYPLWELIIVNDGSTDATREFLGDYLSDPRIKYIENIGNQGIGYSLNRGIDAACNDIIAYLPSDDIFYENHLCALANALLKDPDAALAYSGVKFDSSASPGLLDYKTCKGAIPGYCTQLVQVAHRRTADRWTERSECVSEDYFYLFWRKLTDKGVFVPTSEVTCECFGKDYLIVDYNPILRTYAYINPRTVTVESISGQIVDSLTEGNQKFIYYQRSR